MFNKKKYPTESEIEKIKQDKIKKIMEFENELKELLEKYDLNLIGTIGERKSIEISEEECLNLVVGISMIKDITKSDALRLSERNIEISKKIESGVMNHITKENEEDE